MAAVPATLRKATQMRFSVHSIQLQLPTEFLAGCDSSSKTIRCVLRHHEKIFSTPPQTAVSGSNSWDITSLSSASSESPADAAAPLYVFDNVYASSLSRQEGASEDEKQVLYCYVVAGDELSPEENHRTVGFFRVPFVAARRVSCISLGPFPMLEPSQVNKCFQNHSANRSRTLLF